MRTRLAGWAILLLAAPTRANPSSFHYRTYPHPGLDVHSIAHGPRGDLWLAGPSGLHRFDGIRFRPLATYPFSSARLLARSPNGVIWIGSKDGLVRYQGQFEVVNREPVIGLAATQDAVFVRTEQRFFRLNSDGATVPLTPTADSLLHADPQGDLWFVGPRGGYRLRQGATVADLVAELPPTKDPPYHQFLPGKGHEFWFGRRNTGYGFRSQRKLLRSREAKSRDNVPIVAGRNGQVWYLGDSIQGLNPPANFDIHPATPDEEVFRIGYEDERGRLWLDSRDQQLVEIRPEPGWERWSLADLNGKFVHNIAREANGAMIAATVGGLARLDPTSKKWNFVTNVRSLFVLPQSDGTLLAAVLGQGLVHLTPAGQVIQVIGGPTSRGYRLIHDSANRVWVGTVAGLARLDGSAGSLRLVPVALPGNPDDRSSNNPTQLTLDAQGRLWAGYGRSLAWLDDHGQWHRLDAEPSFGRVRSFSVNPQGNEIWLANRGRGAFYRLTQGSQKWRSEEFSSDAGYMPVDSQTMTRDSRGWIWRLTSEGSRVSDGQRFAPNDWLSFLASTGVAAQTDSGHGILEDPDGSVWVTGEGVTHLTPRPEWFTASSGAAAPEISLAQVNDQPTLTDALPPATFPGPLHRLRLAVASLDTSPFRNEPFLYRLFPGQPEWTPAKNSSIELRDLPPQSYRMEIAYASNQPVTAAVYDFRVQRTWSQWPWPWILGGFGTSALAIWPLRKTLWAQRAHYHFARTLHRARRRPSQDRHSAEDRLHQILGHRYRLDQVLSVGGFSTVYAAFDQQTGRRVAVKLPDRAQGDPAWLRARFAQEVAALQLVVHPGVIPLLDSWIEPDGQPCLVLPLLPSPTLRTWIDEGPGSTARVSPLIAGIGEALAEVHRRGIVHRDLKPENILMDQSQPILIDFGNAAFLGRDEGVARTRILAGSAFYMAPEQFSLHYAPSSDLYSFGVIVLELITGKRLADLACAAVSSAFPEELLRVLVEAGVPNASAVAAKLSEAFAADPSSRPPDAALWSKDLAALLA